MYSSAKGLEDKHLGFDDYAGLNVRGKVVYLNGRPEGAPSDVVATLGNQRPALAAASHYHQVSDETKLPFDWAAGVKFARVNYLIGRAIADAPETLRWYESSFFGNQFAKDRSKAPNPRQAPCVA